jgi:hypothetical protein
LPPRPLYAAAKAVREKTRVQEQLTEMRWGSEPGVERYDQEYRGALMEVAVGS